MVTFEDLRSGKVRLEFGNIEHLRLIREHEKEKEKEKERCRNCDGEGQIVCPACDGTGEIKKNKG